MFTRHSEWIDKDHPAIQALATELDGPEKTREAIRLAARCFEWVRDRIPHTFDTPRETVAATASQTLLEGTGICYAKSHLLTALLRARDVPAALGYQRLAADATGKNFCLHGFVWAWLPPHGWFPLDPRGDKAGVQTRFHPPSPSWAFPVNPPHERTYPKRWAAPPECVKAALLDAANAGDLQRNLPDAPASWTCEP